MKFGEFASSPMSQSLKVGDTKEKSALRKNKFWTKTWFLGSVGWVRVRLGVRKRSIEVVYDPVRSRWGSTCRVTAVSSHDWNLYSMNILMSKDHYRSQESQRDVPV